MMGFWQVGFGLVVLFALGFCDVLLRPESSNWISSSLMPRARVQQTESKVPPNSLSYGFANPASAPQRLSAQYSVKTPARSDFGTPSQDPSGVQSKQLLAPATKLTWSFPSLPEEPKQPDIPFELRHPVPPNSVAAQCGESSIRVEVMEDLFGTGRLLMPSDFTLGGCTATGEDPSAKVLVFETELHECGSTINVTGDELVYTFRLSYTPQEASYSVPIIRSSSVVVDIECHYSRLSNVSSDSLTPAWIPYASTKVAEEVFVFSLKLMTDDWRFERPSNQYFLGDVVNLEASVQLYNHVPVRVFVDSCMATTVPDVTSVPRYSLIENSGCMVDAKLTGSRSQFMPRTRDDKLQFQLETFRFQQPDSGLIYITCTLRVAVTPTSAEPKACSFSANSWVSVDGSDQVCVCCDTTCSSNSSGRDQALRDLRWDRTSVGPINVKKSGYGQQ